MRSYVDELPKNCWECIFADNQKGYCDLQETRILRQFTKRDIGCPLQSLADYTKQVRKEVCEEIGKNVAVDIINFKVYARYDDLVKVLDQIQGETKC